MLSVSAVAAQTIVLLVFFKIQSQHRKFGLIDHSDDKLFGAQKVRVVIGRVDRSHPSVQLLPNKTTISSQNYGGHLLGNELTIFNKVH